MLVQCLPAIARMDYASGMGTGREPAKGPHGTPMRSPVNWALLGLVIERPSYAYELAQRFQRRFGETLQVSTVGHIYTALGILGERELVEEIPGTRDEGRQPRPHYRATRHGVAEYGDWIVSQVRDDRHRRELFVLTLSLLDAEPGQVATVMDRCEQAWLRDGTATRITREGEDEPLPSTVRALIEEEERLAAGAKLAWLEYARQELAKPKRG
jgi:DNA-binding PadR family transcriptional regulator